MLRKVLAITIILLLFSITAFGQVTKGQTAEDLKKTASKFKNGKNYKAGYDKFKDVSMVMYDSFGVVKTGYAVGGIYLQMGVAFFFKGATLTESISEFYFQFKCKSKDWALQKNRNFLAIADNVRFDFGEGGHDGDTERDPFAGVVTIERVMYKISREDLEKLANAKNVDMRVGVHEFQIKDEHKQMFKDMLSLIP